MKDISRSVYTKDGRPAGTPHFNEFEEGLTKKRHAFVLSFEPNFYQGKTVLDVGCGYGVGPVFMVEKGASEVIGIDFNPDAIELANRHYSSDKITYLCEDILEYGFSQSFDLVTATELVEHVTDVELNEILTMFHNVLLDDGLLYISTPERRRPKEDFPQGSHWTEYDYEELIDIITPLGFKFIWGARKDATDNTSMSLLFRKVN